MNNALKNNDKRFINFKNLRNKTYELFHILEEQLCLFLNEIKNLLLNFNESNDVKKSLVLLNLLQLNFLKIIKIHFENFKLEDNYNVFKFIITENKIIDFNKITDYFQDDIRSYSNSILNKVYIRFDDNNNYIYTLPIFVFNLDSNSNCLSIRIFKNKHEDYYYQLTPRFIYENDEINNFYDYLNNIMIQNTSNYLNIIQKLKNEILMVENVISIINN
tara:strand:+ start:1140 stop:1793 length:654 start_codon:yes stop_codon:yes gene_type:complete